ncbi:hypothetical protein RHMOL_Rhmol01G0167700 [Rhododendron molle]|uniref:Uncharacterized protein n=1 Tax=Rhododendron molle TaxID=49168 RepID=A0ACC0Q4X9_RHOML|nr:hypothetical protein RHMOL_Rhmol01G0167700 [Rhododendron molle]
MTALAERWWDTTNTFHLCFGEVTVTPLDFAAFIGLRVGGEPIPFDPSTDLDDTALRWFLGRVPRHSGGVAEYGQFTAYWDHEPADDAEAAQMARAYLLYLFGASLFPLRRSRVHLSYLAGLVDLRQAGRLDWGGVALCTLYCFLGAASRGVGDTIGGYWRVIELWAYEVLGMFPPENTCTNPDLLPRSLAWGQRISESEGAEGSSDDFPALAGQHHRSHGSLGSLGQSGGCFPSEEPGGDTESDLAGVPRAGAAPSTSAAD